MRDTINANTVKAMIKDEAEGAKKYKELARKEKNPVIRALLFEFAKHEEIHHKFWKDYQRATK